MILSTDFVFLQTPVLLEGFNANYIAYFRRISCIHLNFVLPLRGNNYDMFSFPPVVCMLSVTKLVGLLLFFFF